MHRLQKNAHTTPRGLSRLRCVGRVADFEIKCFLKRQGLKKKNHTRCSTHTTRAGKKRSMPFGKEAALPHSNCM